MYTNGFDQKSNVCGSCCRHPWSAGWDSNPRFYGFAIRAIEPLWYPRTKQVVVCFSQPKVKLFCLLKTTFVRSPDIEPGIGLVTISTNNTLRTTGAAIYSFGSLSLGCCPSVLSCSTRPPFGPAFVCISWRRFILSRGVEDAGLLDLSVTVCVHVGQQALRGSVHILINYR